MGLLSSCKLPFLGIIIIMEAIVCIIKCKVLYNINDLKNPTTAMKIQNGHFSCYQDGFKVAGLYLCENTFWYMP